MASAVTVTRASHPANASAPKVVICFPRVTLVRDLQSAKARAHRHGFAYVGSCQSAAFESTCGNGRKVKNLSGQAFGGDGRASLEHAGSDTGYRGV